MESIIIGVAAVVAVITTSTVKNVDWTPKVKHLIATIVSVVLASVLFLTTETLEDINFITAAAAVHGSSQLLYNFLFKGTSMNAKLEGVG